jgi:diacylglycerol O-acyltransferase / wax synthase
VLPLAVPDPVERLRRIAASTRAQRSRQRGASLVVLRPLFRLLTGLGWWQAMVDRQRLVNVFVSNVPGPPATFRLGGREVTGLIPLATPAGNVAVAVAVLSYAGTLTLAVVVDPDVVADPAVVAGGIERELGSLRARVPDAAR